MIREGVESRQLPVDPRREGKRVLGRVEVRQVGDLRGIGVRAGLHAFKGRLRRPVLPAHAAADARLLDELDRRQPQILEQPHVGIESVEPFERRRRIIADVADELADVRPVFLFDVGVVVFLVRPAARELNAAPSAIAIQVVIDKLRPIVRIDAAQREGQRAGDRIKRLPHPLLAFAHDRLCFDPRRVDVGHIQRMEELAFGAVAGMRDQVDFGKAGPCHVPALGLQRNVMFQERAGLRAAVEPLGKLALLRLQPPIDLPRTDPAQVLLDRRRQAQSAARPQWRLAWRGLQALALGGEETLAEAREPFGLSDSPL